MISGVLTSFQFQHPFYEKDCAGGKDRFSIGHAGRPELECKKIFDLKRHLVYLSITRLDLKRFIQGKPEL
jgi:hypothetical protein